MANGWNAVWRALYFGAGTLVVTPLLLMLLNTVGAARIPSVSVAGLAFPHGFVAAAVAFVALELVSKRWIKRLQ